MIKFLSTFSGLTIPPMLVNKGPTGFPENHLTQTSKKRNIIHLLTQPLAYPFPGSTQYNLQTTRLKK